MRNCRPGDTLFATGDEAAALYVLLAGRVDVVFPLRGEDMALEGFEPSSFLGESTFFAPADHHATATGVEELHRATYDELLQSDSTAIRKLAENAAATLAARLQQADGWVWDLLDEIDSVHVAPSWRRYRDRILRR